MKKTILSLLSMAFICAMTLTSCDEIMSKMDNPVDSYLKVDAEVFVKEGSAVELYAETISDAEVTYTVGDEKIAKVEKVSNHEVKVIGVKPGETVIDVKLAANEYYKAGEAKVKVVVGPTYTLKDAVVDGAKLKIGYKFNGKDCLFAYEYDADKKAFIELEENSVPQEITDLYEVSMIYNGEDKITQKLISKENGAVVPLELNLYTGGSFDRIYKLPCEMTSLQVNNYEMLPYVPESVTPVDILTPGLLPDNMAVGVKGAYPINIFPDNATNQVIKFTSSDPNVITIDAAGNFECVAAGTATIKAEATDGSGKFVEKEITVTLPIVDLSELTAPYIAKNGEVLTGETYYKISIAENATVSLSGATITNSVECLGTATIVLVKETVNTITNYGSTALIASPAEKTLTIKGEGQLNANGGGDNAGIGSPNGGTCGNIVIEGGIINARTSYGAAIGAGDGGGVCGDITISGGTVTATKNSACGAAIGSGDSWGGGSACGNITITGGTVTAIGGISGPGIGAGGLEADYNSTCKNITITGGKVTATGGQYAAGIGTGYGSATYTSKSSCGNITISGGTVVATKGDNATWDVGPSNSGQVGTVSVSVTVKDKNGNPASIYSGAASAPRRANAKALVLPLPTPRR